MTEKRHIIFSFRFSAIQWAKIRLGESSCALLDSSSFLSAHSLLAGAEDVSSYIYICFAVFCSSISRTPFYGIPLLNLIRLEKKLSVPSSFSDIYFFSLAVFLFSERFRNIFSFFYLTNLGAGAFLLTLFFMCICVYVSLFLSPFESPPFTHTCISIVHTVYKCIRLNISSMLLLLLCAWYVFLISIWIQRTITPHKTTTTTF